MTLVRAEVTLARWGTVSIVAEVRRGRVAPPCRDPDSPSFSDPGDSAEVELLAVMIFESETAAREVDLLGSFFAPRMLDPTEARACEQAAAAAFDGRRD